MPQHLSVSQECSLAVSWVGLWAPSQQRLKYMCVDVGSIASSPTLRDTFSFFPSSLTWDGEVVIRPCLWTWQVTGEFEVGTERELAFGFNHCQWEMAPGRKGENCPICRLSGLLSGSFRPAQHYLFLSWEKGKIKYIVITFFLVLEESFLMS